MADAKISALPSATYTSGDQFPFVRSGVTSRGSLPLTVSGANIGIGTTPTGFLANKLVVATGGTLNEGITIYSSSNNGALWFADGTTGSEAFRGGFDYQHSTDSMTVYAAGIGALTLNSTAFQPGIDNNRTLGAASFRWSEVFAGNGTINTSDAEEKTDIAELDDAELAVAAELKGLVRKYRWKDSVKAKGKGARIHVGVMAQDVAAAFKNHGLNAERYGVFCKDTLEDGTVRLGVRYDQLWAFIIATL